MSKVYSTHAQEAVDRHIEVINELMGIISTEMGKYKSLQRSHYGHAGDLAYVEEVMGQAWEFIAGTE